MDVKCKELGSGGYYYPEHLPVLGECEGLSGGDLVVGTKHCPVEVTIGTVLSQYMCGQLSELSEVTFT